MIGKMFVNPLKMPVVPLVIFSLICGVTGIGDIRVLGHLGGRSLVLYIVTTGLAVSIAILPALVIGPGVDRLMDMIRTAVNITGDAVVSTIVAKGEDKIDMAVFNDPDAGMMTSDELDIDEEAERELAQYAKPH